MKGNDPERRILLVVPVFTHVLPAAFYNFCALMVRTGRDLKDRYGITLMQAERQLLHMAMNQAVEAVLSDPQYAALIAFDDDCLPPVDAVTQLMAHYEAGKHYVAGMGYMRNYPHTTTVGKYYEEGPTLIEGTNEAAGFYWLDSLPTKERGVIEADFCGVPIVLMSRELLEKVEKPLFGYADESGGQMTHDIYCARRVQAAGYPILVDTSIECGHIGPAPIITGVNRTVARAAVQWTERAERAAAVKQVSHGAHD